MKKLNKRTTQIFCDLLTQLDGGYKKFFADGFMPLTMENIGGDIQTPWGIGNQYSLCHYYEQNGDLMQDPEMCFVVVDNRTEERPEVEFVGIYPYSFQQANLGLYNESITIVNNKLEKFTPAMQADHTHFAQQWLTNIKDQGFLR